MIIILDNIRSAHNVGSIIRTCDALGISRIILGGITPGPKENSKVKKTSLGAESNVRITRALELTETITDLKNGGYHVVALEISDKAININKFEHQNKKIALVVGNEVNGVSEEILGVSDTCIKIPMLGVKESLNVSVAFGIAAFNLKNNLPSDNKRATI